MHTVPRVFYFMGVERGGSGRWGQVCRAAWSKTARKTDETKKGERQVEVLYCTVVHLAQIADTRVSPSVSDTGGTRARSHKAIWPQRRGLRRDWEGAEWMLNQLAAFSLVINIFLLPHWDRYYRVTADRENWNWGERRWYCRIRKHTGVRNIIKGFLLGHLLYTISYTIPPLPTGPPQKRKLPDGQFCTG